MPRKKKMTKEEALEKMRKLKSRLLKGELTFEKYAEEKRKLKPFVFQKE